MRGTRARRPGRSGRRSPLRSPRPGTGARCAGPSRAPPGRDRSQRADGVLEPGRELPGRLTGAGDERLTEPDPDGPPSRTSSAGRQYRPQAIDPDRHDRAAGAHRDQARSRLEPVHRPASTAGALREDHDTPSFLEKRLDRSDRRRAVAHAPERDRAEPRDHEPVEGLPEPVVVRGGDRQTVSDRRHRARDAARECRGGWRGSDRSSAGRGRRARTSSPSIRGPRTRLPRTGPTTR